MLLRSNGAAIRAIRERHGLSLRQLARDIGMDPGTLSRIENQHKSTSPKSLKAIADRLSVPIDAIIYHAPEPEPEKVA